MLTGIETNAVVVPYGVDIEFVARATGSIRAPSGSGEGGSGTFTLAGGPDATFPGPQPALFPFETVFSPFNLPDGFTVQSADAGIVNNSFSSGVVPVPAALPLFLSALVALGLVARRRNKVA